MSVWLHSVPISALLTITKETLVLSSMVPPPVRKSVTTIFLPLAKYIAMPPNRNFVAP
jgi:hypothetical protein